MHGWMNEGLTNVNERMNKMNEKDEKTENRKFKMSFKRRDWTED